MCDFTLPVYPEKGMVQIILLIASFESFKPSLKKKNISWDSLACGISLCDGVYFSK